MTDTHPVSPFRDMDISHQFNPPQTTFGLGRRPRPPPVHIEGQYEVEGKVPLKSSTLERRESKGGLRAIFTRTNKSERSIVTAVPEDSPVASAFSERSMKTAAETSLPRSLSMKRITTVPSETTPATPNLPRISRMNLRSKSVKSNKTPNKTPALVESKSPNMSKPSPNPNNPKAPSRTSPSWDPPPLFQAYPQAIKHATLSASTLSADAILRMSNHRPTHNQQSREGLDSAAAVRKTNKARSKHRRHMSGSISKAEWTQKIFVLVTSGYLLQYASSGSFDRLPEKMLQLGKESVAFASDVIPGKHWVLQVSQAMDADGTPAADSRSLLSRLTFRGADYRRTATSFLLVLDSAQEMDSWIALVRREIEALGGKKHASETGKPKSDEKIIQLRAQPSHRYLVQKDNDRLSNPSSPQSPSLAAPWSVDSQIQRKPESVASTSIEAHPSSIRPSTGQLSTTNSVISHDGQQLESLRDSTHRFSYMSSGQRTLITSQGSSPDTTPVKETFDEIPSRISIEESRPRPNASAINERRRSMQSLPNPILEAQTIKNFRPHSTYGAPSRPVRSSSPIMPNFSIPNPSIKRYPVTNGPAVKISARLNDTPDIPTIVTTNKSYEPFIQKPKKAPPIALRVTVANPSSRTNEYPTTTRQPQVSTPTESSFSKVQQAKPAVVEIHSRSPSGAKSEHYDATSSHRKSTMMTPKAAQASQAEDLLPKRLSRINRGPEKYAEAPQRPPPLLPAEEVFTLLPSLMPKPANKEESDLNEREQLSPLPDLLISSNQLRQPTSIQLRPTSCSPSQNSQSSPSPLNQPSRSSPATMTTSSLTMSPVQRLKREEKRQALANRRSVPVLASGPPPAPPPSCALPPLPPGSSGGLKPPPSPLSLRNFPRT